MVLTYVSVLIRILSNPLANVFQKQLTAKGHPPSVVNFNTYFLLSLFTLVLIWSINWSRLPVPFWIYSVGVGILGALGNSFLVKALQSGDLSVLGPINAYKAVVGLIVGVLLLGEIPNFWGIVGMALIIGGSYFVLDTTGDKFSWNLLKQGYIQYRLWAMVLAAIEAVLIKKAILYSSPTASFITWCWFGALFSFFFTFFNPVNRIHYTATFRTADLKKYFYLILCIGLMQLTTNYVFENMAVGYALSLFQVSAIVSVFLGYKIFREKDIYKKLLGTAIMLIGSTIIILLK